MGIGQRGPERLTPTSGRTGGDGPTGSALVALILIVFGAVALYVGYHCFQPHRATIKPVRGSGLELLSAPQLASIEITIEPAAHGGIYVSTSITPTGSKTQTVNITWTFAELDPSELHDVHTNGFRNVLSATSIRPSGASISGDLTAHPAGGHVAVAKVKIDDPHQFVVTNGSELESKLPTIDLGSEATGTPSVLMEERLPQAADFDWNQGSEPDKIDFSDPLDFTWIESATNGTYPLDPGTDAPLVPPRVLDASNPTASSHDIAYATVAGVLYGVAGGAFLSAIQEGLHAIPRRR
jgi:hypothetical protein